MARLRTSSRIRSRRANSPNEVSGDNRPQRLVRQNRATMDQAKTASETPREPKAELGMTSRLRSSRNPGGVRRRTSPPPVRQKQHPVVVGTTVVLRPPRKAGVAPPGKQHAKLGTPSLRRSPRNVGDEKTPTPPRVTLKNCLGESLMTKSSETANETETTLNKTPHTIGQKSRGEKRKPPGPSIESLFADSSPSSSSDQSKVGEGNDADDEGEVGGGGKDPAGDNHPPEHAPQENPNDVMNERNAIDVATLAGAAPVQSLEESTDVVMEDSPAGENSWQYDAAEKPLDSICRRGNTIFDINQPPTPLVKDFNPATMGVMVKGNNLLPVASMFQMTMTLGKPGKPLNISRNNCWRNQSQIMPFMYQHKSRIPPNHGLFH